MLKRIGILMCLAVCVALFSSVSTAQQKKSNAERAGAKAMRGTKKAAGVVGSGIVSAGKAEVKAANTVGNGVKSGATALGKAEIKAQPKANDYHS